MAYQEPPKKPRFQVERAGSGFAVIAKSALLDFRLSYAARGILAASIANTQVAIFDSAALLANTVDDKTVLIGALKELRLLGYLVKCPGEEQKYMFSDVPVNEVAELQSVAPVQPVIDLPSFGRSQSATQLELSAAPAVASSQGRTRSGKSAKKLEMPEWLEEYRQEMESWQLNRSKRHPKLQMGITKTSLSGLLYAKESGVLREFCQHASENCWQSLGFAGHREYIDKLVRDKSRKSARTNQAIAPINYTLG